MNQSQINFINSISPQARADFKRSGVLPSITIAQGILESGWGSHAPGDNLFGVEWTAGCGFDFVEVPTKEFYGGEYHTIMARFRSYNSFADSVADHTNILMLSRYDRVRGVKDYKNQAQYIKICGYATDPNYPSSLINLIECYNLDDYDMEVDEMIDKIVLYFGDADIFPAVPVSQAEHCPLMKKADFEAAGMKANTIIQIGGKPESDRVSTVKEAAALL